MGFEENSWEVDPATHTSLAEQGARDECRCTWPLKKKSSHSEKEVEEERAAQGLQGSTTPSRIFNFLGHMGFFCL